MRHLSFTSTNPHLSFPQNVLTPPTQTTQASSEQSDDNFRNHRIVYVPASNPFKPLKAVVSSKTSIIFLLDALGGFALAHLQFSLFLSWKLQILSSRCSVNFSTCPSLQPPFAVLSPPHSQHRLFLVKLRSFFDWLCCSFIWTG